MRVGLLCPKNPPDRQRRIRERSIDAQKAGTEEVQTGDMSPVEAFHTLGATETNR
jgi:hypothetical protein